MNPMKLTMITPSYGPDFDRCKLLCESFDKYVDESIRHVLIVDRRDRAQFAPLASSRREIRVVEEIVPWWIKRLPFARKWWLSMVGMPVRNWILQQLVKLSVDQIEGADGYIFVDSDVAFFRPFHQSELVSGNALKLFRVPDVANYPTHWPWHRTAGKLLGLPIKDYYGATYIGNQITWRRDCLKELHKRIESVHGMSWQRAVCNQWHLSEYILYGIFVEHVLGIEKAGHYASAEPLCHISWDYKMDTPEQVAFFFTEVKPKHNAVMVSAKHNIEPKSYIHLLEDLEKKALGKV